MHRRIRGTQWQEFPTCLIASSIFGCFGMLWRRPGTAAFGAVEAVIAASFAMKGDGVHAVPLDVSIETMRQTGADMSD